MAALSAEQVELRLDEEQVDAALEQAAACDLVRVAELGEADLAERRRTWCRGRSSRRRTAGGRASSSRRPPRGRCRAPARLISWARSAMPYSPSGTAKRAEGAGLDDVDADLEERGVQLAR